MRSLHESRERWKAFFETYNSTFLLKQDVLKKQHSSPPGDVGLRSLCWKLFFLLPTFHPSTWSPHISSYRAQYSDLCKKLLTPLEESLPYDDLEETTIDPLAEDDSNPWRQLRKDEELRKEIQLDVERCMPDVPYFRSPEVQKRLTDILFIYCKLNQDVGYRQGMHEIAATILWVVDSDAIMVENEEIASTSEDDAFMLGALDSAYVEHDTFSLFQVVMRSAKAWYVVGDEGRVSEDGGVEKKGDSPIIEKSRVIHETYLTAVDPELAVHLKELEVLPQVFLIRWIRLLFGREFPFNQLLVFWDCLFSEDPNFTLVDFVCVAMLLRVRWQLIEADYPTAVTLLLRYPSLPPPHLPASLVLDAIYLRTNMNAVGGSHIIQKYSDRAPLLLSSIKSPFGSLRSARVRPLTPTRFIPSQAGLEGLVQDVARGVLDTGEKWGVNKAVRDVMGEVRRNVEAVRIDPQLGSALSPMNHSTMESRVASLKRKLKQQEERQKTLANMLSTSLDDLAALSSESSSESGAQGISHLLAVISHVRDCLLSESIQLDEKLLSQQATSESFATIFATSNTPTVSPRVPPLRPSKPSSPLRSQAPHLTAYPPQSPPPPSPLTLSPIPNTPPQHTLKKTSAIPVSQPSSPAQPPAPPAAFPKPTFRSSTPSTNSTNKPPNSPSAHHRARSSLAQSNFAWMLGEDPLAIRKKSVLGGADDSIFGDGYNVRTRRGSKVDSTEVGGGGGENEVDLFGVGPGGKRKARQGASTNDKDMGSIWGPAREEGLDLGSL